jgi:hypothetical protein
MTSKQDTWKRGLRLLLPAAIALGAAAPVLLASDAQARRYAKPYYSETYDTGRRPARGYEGFLFPDYYCSYKRYPKRVCNTDRRGREMCRVTGWTLEQTCQ